PVPHAQAGRASGERAVPGPEPPAPLTRPLATGAELRVTGPDGATCAVVCVNGGTRAAVAGTWSASLGALRPPPPPARPPPGRPARASPGPAFGGVGYGGRGGGRLDWSPEDALAAIEALGAPRTLLVGFSRGGAVSARAAAAAAVETVLGLAPWLPQQLSLEP